MSRIKPNPDLVARKLSELFKLSGAYSEEHIHQIVFHLTDWIEDLGPFADFLVDPDSFDNDAAMSAIIKFLAHAPDHLRVAAEIVLEPDQDA